MQESASKALAKLIEDEHKNKKAEEERLKKLEDRQACWIFDCDSGAS